jgi:hypothetical protein
MLPSVLANDVGSDTFGISGLNHAARALAVYASWSRSPVCCSTTTQDSLPAVRLPTLAGRASLLPEVPQRVPS